VRNIDKNPDKMSHGELRVHVKELRAERVHLMSELRAAVAIKSKRPSYRLRWLCVAVLCFLIVGVVCYYY
jgi:hypothetical protein